MDNDPILDALSEHLTPGVDVWDIGAYEGTYIDLALSSEVESVSAFEPRQTTVASLIETYHGVDRVTIYPIALWSNDGWGELRENDGGPSTAAFHHRADGYIPTSTMDRVAARTEYPDVVKIDVEGGEGHVLDGGDQVLENASTVLVEVHNDPKASTSISHYGYDAEYITEKLQLHDYDTEVYGDESDATFHVLATSPDPPTR